MNYPQSAFDKTEQQCRTTGQISVGRTEISDAKPSSPVCLALSEAREMLGECMHQAQQLVSAIDPALRLQAPVSDAKSPPRPMMASPLVEEIQSIIDQASRLREVLLNARERVTL